MEYSRVAAFDEEEKVTEKRASVSYHYLYPCDLLQEVLRGLFKCFGLEKKSSDANEEQEAENTAGSENPETSTTPSTPERQVEDPSDDPEEAADPPSSTSENTEIAAASARVVRPPIGTGRGPQIN